jgi:glycine oxidase
VSPHPYPDRHDVVVLGGGAIGLAVAWRAAQRGLTVALVERGDLGRGASHVAAGMLAPVSEADAGERELLELGLRSAAAWPAFAAELAEASGKDLGYRTTGTLVLARDGDEAEALERELTLREHLGLRVERLLPSAARRLEPALAPTLRAAFLAPDDHTVDPRRLTAALVVAAARAGVEYRVGQEVSAVLPGEGVEIEGRQVVEAPQIVVAGGAWSSGLPGLPAVPVRPVKGQTLRLRGRAGEPPLLERPVRYEGGYLVPRAVTDASAGVEVVLGATVEEQGFDTTLTAGGVYELLRDAAELVPGVLELEIGELLAGLRPGTPDNAPLLGEHDGVTYATGHHRNGVLLTPVTAELVAAHLAGASAIPTAFAPGRFARAAA